MKRKTAFSLLFSILSISRRKAPFVLHLLSLNLWRGREPGCAPRRQCHWALQPKKQAAFPTSAPRTISQGSIIFALYVLPPSWLLGQFSSSSFSLLPSLGLCKTRQLYACLSPSPTRSLPHSLSRSLSPLSLPIAAFLGLIPISQLCAACFPPSSSRSSVLSLSLPLALSPPHSSNIPCYAPRSGFSHRQAESCSLLLFLLESEMNRWIINSIFRPSTTVPLPTNEDKFST